MKRTGRRQNFPESPDAFLGTLDANRERLGLKSLEERMLEIFTNNNTLELQRSIRLHLHVHTPTAHLQSSDTSVAPPPRIPTRAARLQSSRSPYLF